MIDRSEEAFPDGDWWREDQLPESYYVINLRLMRISYPSLLIWLKTNSGHVHVSRIAATCNITSLSYRTLFLGYSVETSVPVASF